MVKIVRLMKAAPAPRLNRVSTWSFVPNELPKKGEYYVGISKATHDYRVRSRSITFKCDGKENVSFTAKQFNFFHMKLEFLPPLPGPRQQF